MPLTQTTKHLCEIRIDLRALAQNLSAIRRQIPATTRVMAVVKADAYGHGAIDIARALESLGINDFGVAHVAEAQRLRAAGIGGRMVVFQPDYHIDRAAYGLHNLECCIHAPEDLAYWDGGPLTDCHLFVDTGMGREGALPEVAHRLVDRILDHNALRLVGVATHFATADEELRHAHRQLARFQTFLAELPHGLRQRVEVHAANSGAVVNLPEAHFDVVRPGMLLFGQYNGLGPFEQHPVMSVHARIVQVKDLPADYPVGYGATYRTKTPTRIGLISIGYGDGFNWRQSNRGHVWLHGQPYPVIGRVSMDQIAIDLGLDSPVKLGDEALIFGPNAENNLIHDAQNLQTIAYERCCQLGMRLPRIVVN